MLDWQRSHYFKLFILGAEILLCTSRVFCFLGAMTKNASVVSYATICVLSDARIWLSVEFARATQQNRDRFAQPFRQACVYARRSSKRLGTSLGSPPGCAANPCISSASACLSSTICQESGSELGLDWLAPVAKMCTSLVSRNIANYSN